MLEVDKADLLEAGDRVALRVRSLWDYETEYACRTVVRVTARDAVLDDGSRIRRVFPFRWTGEHEEINTLTSARRRLRGAVYALEQVRRDIGSMSAEACDNARAGVTGALKFFPPKPPKAP